MSHRTAWACFIAAWLACLVALAPMRWLGELDFWQRAGLSATGASGTVWNGRLLGLASGGNEWGDVRAGLSPFALIGGTAALALESPRGRGELHLGRERGLRDASGEGLLALQTPQGPVTLALSLDAVTTIFRNERCSLAAGRLDAAVTLPAGATPSPRLVLSGAPTCREGVVEVRLLPADGSPTVELLLQARHDGDYRLTWLARAPEPALAAALGLAGFTASPDGMVRVDEGGLSRPREVQE